MGVSEDRRQRTEDSNVARMKPRGIRVSHCSRVSFLNQFYTKICKKQGGWVSISEYENKETKGL